MNYHFEQDPNEEWEDLPSKSQLKRDSEALQELGVELVNLTQRAGSSRWMRSWPMPSSWPIACAARRKPGPIGRLMRSRDTDEIEQALDVIRSRHGAGNARMHKLEPLREKLLRR